MCLVLRVGSQVVFNYLGAGFEPRCRRKDVGTACVPLLLLLAACCLLLLACLLLAKMCCSHLDPKRACKTSTG